MRIERSSSYDGDGLRTVIFLKGCPLSCLWCSTPESQSFTNEIGCNDTKCIHCGSCVSRCENQALSLDTAGFPRVLNGQCNGCAACYHCCPVQAISIYGKQMSVADTVKEIEKDAVFYFHSGGGFTFSGGEPLAQPYFVAEVFKLAMQRGINGTIETCGHVPWENIALVLPYIDRLFIDLKHMDPQYHQKITGHSNDLILENIKKTDACGKQISIRIPVIPTINDGDENIQATAAFCKGLNNICELELLAYHRLGMIKYRSLGRPMALQDIDPPHLDDMMGIAKKFKSALPELPIKINGSEI